MNADYSYEPLILSSSCPYSCSLAAFALKLGATIDPEFLLQCQIADPKFQQRIDGLKSIPLVYETPSRYFLEQENLYLDMGTPEHTSFVDPWEFKEYNAWFDTPDQWNSINTPIDDLRIEFL